jgi:hypothetical protein
VELWGLLSPRWAWPFGLTRPYRSWEELRERVRDTRPFAVCLPFLWPETFSFVTYEAFFLLRAPVVVGPFGHPAQLVAAEGWGVVMRAASTRGLLDAFRTLEQRHAELDARLQERWPVLLEEHSTRRALQRIEAVYGPLAPLPGDGAWKQLCPDAPLAPPAIRAGGLTERLGLRLHDWLCALPGGASLWDRTMQLTARLARRI